MTWLLFSPATHRSDANAPKFSVIAIDNEISCSTRAVCVLLVSLANTQITTLLPHNY